MYRQIYRSETVGKRVRKTHLHNNHIIQLYYDDTFLCVEGRDFFGPFLQEKQLDPFSPIWQFLIKLGAATQDEVDENRKSVLRRAI